MEELCYFLLCLYLGSKLRSLTLKAKLDPRYVEISALELKKCETGTLFITCFKKIPNRELVFIGTRITDDNREWIVSFDHIKKCDRGFQIKDANTVLVPRSKASKNLYPFLHQGGDDKGKFGSPPPPEFRVE